jgi:hypothetical protein
MPLTIALFALLALPARAEAPLFQITSRRVILPASFIPVTPDAPIVAPVALVVEEGSQWDRPGVLEGVIGKASGIFARCGVTLGAAEVVTVKWSAEGLKRLNSDDPYQGPAQMGVMDEPLIPKRRPVGFLFERSVPAVAEAYNADSVERFTPRFPAAAKLLDTFWITVDELTRKPRQDEGPTYSTFAHELTHILGDLPHTDAAPNLMTNAETPQAKSGDLTPEQCAEIRKLR